MTAYSLHSGGSYGLAASGDSGGFTLGTEFEVADTIPLTAIPFFSGPLAAGLPTECGIWDIGTSSLVAGTHQTSPSWSGAAGSGWVLASYGGSVSLVPGTKYVTSVFASSGGLNWFYDISGYWTSGAGAGGITNGPLSAPGSAAAVNGQAVFVNAGVFAFPDETVSGFDFGVDVLVTAAPASASGLLVASFP
jgi:hypothetical protein